MKPLYERVPRSREDVTGWFSWFLWAWFGNDDDGVQGEKIPPGIQFDDGGYPFGSDQPLTVERFWRWHKRNPAHNLSFHVLLRPVVRPIYILGSSKPFAEEVWRPIVLRFRPFFLKVGYGFVGWRSDTPFPGAWGKFGEGGGKFDIGLKDLT